MSLSKHPGTPTNIGAVRRVLIVKLSSLGDVLMATGAAHAIREAFPNIELGWVVEGRCAPVVENNSFVNNIHIWDRTARGLWRVVQEMKAVGYDLALDLQGLLKSGVMAWLSGAGVRVGFADGREGGNLFLTECIQPRKAYYWPSEKSLHLVAELGVPVSPDRHRLFFPIHDRDNQRIEELLSGHGLMSQRFVALAPATTRDHKHWVLERWSHLAVALWEKYALPSVLFGSERDADLLTAIANNASPRPITFPGTLALKDAVGLIGHAAVLVGLDSFLIHAAVAVRTPTVALFGPYKTSRFDREEGITILEHELGCRPCYQNPTCPNGVAPEKHWCMKLTTVSQVVEAVGHHLVLA